MGGPNQWLMCEVAVIDTYKGTTKSTPKIMDAPLGTAKDGEETRVETLRCPPAFVLKVLLKSEVIQEPLPFKQRILIKNRPFSKQQKWIY